jgi:hypothetical protein
MKQLSTFLKKSIDLKQGETIPLLLSFSYFFCLMCAYYIIRPLRDEMGIQGGIDNLPWVFTGTFVAILAMVPLYGWVSSRYPAQAVPAHRLWLLHLKPADLLRTVSTWTCSCPGRTDLLHLVQCLQPVRDLGVLEFHG